MDNNIENNPIKNQPFKLFIYSTSITNGCLLISKAYSLSGSALSSPLLRKYKDFISLRSALVERWPGIVIPSFPLKKLLDNNEHEDIIETMLNRFCHQISNIPFLFESPEMRCFLGNYKDISKALSLLEPLSYQTLIKRFSETFPNYDVFFDAVQGKTNQRAFYQRITATIPKLIAFKDH